MQNDGLKFSDYIIGTMRLGKWGAQFDTQEYDRYIRACIDLEYIDFDHADIYGDYTTEAEFGKVLAQDSGLRKKMRLITKCGIKMECENRPQHKLKSYDSSKAHIIQSVEQSLKNLHTDYLDILLLHRPDVLLDADEISEAFSELKTAGKVLHFGVSNYTPSQFDLLNDRVPLCTNQVEASVLKLDPFHDGTFDQLQKHKIIPTIWSPLAGGAFFSGDTNKRVKDILLVAKDLSNSYNCDIDNLLLSWLMKHPSGPVCILGTTKIERIKKYKIQKIDLSREDWYKLYEACIGSKVA